MTHNISQVVVVPFVFVKIMTHNFDGCQTMTHNFDGCKIMTHKFVESSGCPRTFGNSFQVDSFPHVFLHALPDFDVRVETTFV